MKTSLSIAAVACAIACFGVAARPAPAAAADPHALFARERRASGGDAWNRVAALRAGGTIISGGSPSAFTQVLDRKTGWSKIVTAIGPIVDVSGFDGVAWDFQGSTVSETTLPGLQADNVTQAYIGRDGWWRRDDPATMTSLGADGGDDGVRVTPAGGSSVDVWFDRATGLIDRTVGHTDAGAVVTHDSDYRTVGDLVISFRSVEDDPTGVETIVNSRYVTPLATLAAHALARPQPRFLSRIANGTTAVVPFHFNPFAGWAFTTLHVGARPSPVIFDSGASNYFTPAAAKRLALRSSGGLPLTGVGNGSVTASIANLGTIALGSAQLVKQHGVVAPLPYAIVHPSAHDDIDGLIGAEFLQNLRTTFDFPTRTIVLEPFARPSVAPPGAVALPMLSDGSHAYVRASVDGVSGVFLLDTGDNGDITVFRRFAVAHGLFRGTGAAYLSPGGVGGHLGLERYRARSFALGGGTFHGPPVSVTAASAGAFASRSVAGNIGIRILSRYRVTFDFDRKTVTFVPKTVGLPLHVDRTGMSLNQDNPASFVVLSTVAGSPAATAGVKAGDRIVALDGESIATHHFGFLDAAHLIGGRKSYTLTIAEKDGTQRTVTIEPRDILPAAE